MTAVAVDVRRMQDAPLQGVGRYLANTLPLVARQAELVLLGDARRARPVIAGLEGVPYVPLPLPARLPEVFWLQWSASRWLRRGQRSDPATIFHGTFNSAPRRMTQSLVVNIYDLSFEHHPEDFGAAKRRLFQLQGRDAARRADRILCPTEAVRADVLRSYRVEPARVLVSACAVDPVFHPRLDAEIDEIAVRLGLRRPYVVGLGGARRRGLPVALGAWRAANGRARGVDFVAVGGETLPAEPGVHSVGRLRDADWAAVLAGASAFCYPTRYEGFGMPALEAAASGTPVVCQDLAVLREVLGPAAEWCVDASAPAIAAGLSRVLDEPSRRAELRTLGLARATAAPTWKDAADVVLRAYREAMT